MATARSTIPLVQPSPHLDYQIGGHPIQIHVWTYEQWQRLPERDRPGEAREYKGVGWVEVASVPHD